MRQHLLHTDEYKNQFNNRSTTSLLNLDYEPKILEKNQIKYVDYKDLSNGFKLFGKYFGKLWW